MNDRGKIVVGLIVFLGLLTFPVWANLAGGAADFEPKLQVPAGETDCVAPTEYMRSSHMDVITEWRDQVIREGNRIYVDHKGREHLMSLTGTCLGCHQNKAEFCDQCHSYVGVSPYCWDCHNEPKESI
jgi:hypothetical protein